MFDFITVVGSIVDATKETNHKHFLSRTENITMDQKHLNRQKKHLNWCKKHFIMHRKK